MTSIRRHFGIRRLLALILVAGLGVLSAVPAAAQQLDYRSPDQVPPSWGQFAKLVKYRSEEWVSGDDAIAARFRVYAKIHSGKEDGPPATVTVRVWVNPDGTVARVQFPAFKDAGATQDLRTILTRGNIGEAPPPEMLQPLNLRFSLILRK